MSPVNLSAGLLLVGGVVLCACDAPPHFSAPGALREGASCSGNKVLVCHTDPLDPEQPKTLCVPEPAADALLSAGATFGECGGAEPPGCEDAGVFCGEGTVLADGLCVAQAGPGPGEVCGPGTLEQDGLCLGTCIEEVACGVTGPLGNTCEGSQSCVGDDCTACALAEIEEVCNGVDDDCDGVADEGFADADDDGVVDCLDACVGSGLPDDTCDGVDDDCDGLVDEDAPDSDGDGISDCEDACPEDPEPCEVGRVFVTSTPVYPNFGDQADATCQGLAESAGLAASGEQFRAWVSDPDGSAPADDFSRFDTYVLIDGTDTGFSWDGPNDQITIDVDEGGNVVTPIAGVWTNVTPTGENAGTGTCSAWSGAFDADGGARGFIGAGDGLWSIGDSLASCNALGYLYCFEQR